MRVEVSNEDLKQKVGFQGKVRAARNRFEQQDFKVGLVFQPTVWVVN